MTKKTVTSELHPESHHAARPAHHTVRPGRSKRSVWLQLAVALAIVAGATFISWHMVNKAARSVSYVPAKLSECQNANPKQYDCYAKYYAALAYNQGNAAAFKDMEAAYNTDDFVKSQCHQLAHIVGRTSFEKTGSLEKAYAQGDNFCWSGFYHGAIEQAVKAEGAAKIKQNANTICQEFAKKQQYSFDHFNCVHGLGHGLMAVSDYNLFDALKLCDGLIDSWEQSSCYGGVYMENVMVASRNDGTTAYFKAGDPLYPCDAVDYTYKEQCYLMQTSYILQHNGYDFAKTFQECGRADSAFVDTCYRSAGRDASGSTVSDVSGTITNCRAAGDNHDAVYNCMLGAERDFVSYYHNTDKANQLCEAFGGDYTEPCKQDVADYYKTF